MLIFYNSSFTINDNNILQHASINVHFRGIDYAQKHNGHMLNRIYD